MEKQLNFTEDSSSFLERVNVLLSGTVDSFVISCIIFIKLSTIRDLSKLAVGKTTLGDITVFTV